MTDAGSHVWVLDSSALVATKQLISVSDQWAAFKQMEQLVEQGAIAMPRQVINEVKQIAHPDIPGAWAPGVRFLQVHPLRPDYAYVKRVMAEAGKVADAEKGQEDADPWVIALALQLLDEGYATTIATDDHVDRDIISIATACNRLGVEWCRPRAFLEAIGVTVKKDTDSDDPD